MDSVKSGRGLCVSFCQALGEKPWEIIALQNSQGRGAKWSLVFVAVCLAQEDAGTAEWPLAEK